MRYLILFLTFLLSSINTSLATSFNESGDAGELITTAQETVGRGNLSSISGSFIRLPDGPTNDDDFQKTDVDTYKIKIVDVDAFSVSMTADMTDNDALMWVFREDGGLAFTNDDEDFDAGLYLPRIFAGDLSSEDVGMFFLAVSVFLVEPNTLNLADGWDRLGQFNNVGSYALSITGAEVSKVPEAPVLFLLSFGLIALIRKKIAA